MKKNLIILSIAFLCTINISAQLKLGVRGGISTTVWADSHNVINNSNSKPQYYVGPCLEFMIQNIGVETAVLYSRRAFKVSGNDSNVKQDFLEIPLNLRGTIPTSNKVKIYLTAGPYIGFKISGNNSFNNMWDNVDNTWKSKSFTAGLNFGTGVELFKNYRIGLNYNLGLTDNYKESDGNYGVRYRVLSVAAGLYF